MEISYASLLGYDGDIGEVAMPMAQGQCRVLMSWRLVERNSLAGVQEVVEYR